MPAEVNVEELPNMEGDDYPDGMYVFVYCYIEDCQKDLASLSIDMTEKKISKLKG
jgi:hypothetical protein